MFLPIQTSNIIDGSVLVSVWTMLHGATATGGGAGISNAWNVWTTARIRVSSGSGEAVARRVKIEKSKSKERSFLEAGSEAAGRRAV